MSFQTSFSAYYASRTSLPHTLCLCHGKEQFDNKRISAKARGMSSFVDLSKRCRTTKTVKLIEPQTFSDYISEAAGRKLPSNTSDPLDTSTCGELLFVCWVPGCCGQGFKWFAGPVARWVFDQLLSLCGNLQGNLLLKERVLSTCFVFSELEYLSKFPWFQLLNVHPI